MTGIPLENKEYRRYTKYRRFFYLNYKTIKNFYYIKQETNRKKIKAIKKTMDICYIHL